MNFATDYANMREKIDLAYREMIDSIQELHDISDDGCRELIEEYADVITEINAVYKSIEDCAVDTAFSLGLATKENEDYFNFEKYEDEIKASEHYIELDTGEVVYITR